MPASNRLPGEGKTRWRRFALAFVPTVALVGTVMTLMAVGVLALPITVSGTVFTVAGTSLTIPVSAQGPGAFKQYGNVDVAGGLPVGVATTELTAGTINNLDQTVCGATGLPGPFAFLKVELKANPAEATNSLIVDATSLDSTDATFTNIEIGVPVVDPRLPNPNVTPANPTFGQTADNVVINGLSQKAVYTKAGTFKLTGLHLVASLQSGTC